MNIDIAELRRLAAAVVSAKSAFEQAYAHRSKAAYDAYYDKRVVLDAAANPATILALLDRLASAEAVVRECIDVMALTEDPPFRDPDHGREVEDLGNRIGFGALMSSASASWRLKLKRTKTEGGEFVAGPCQITVAQTLTGARGHFSKYSENQTEEQPHE